MKRWIWLLIPSVLVFQGQAPTLHLFNSPLVSKGPIPSPPVEGSLWLGGLTGVVALDLETAAVENPTPYGFSSRAIAVDPVRDRIWTYALGTATGMDAAGQELFGVYTGRWSLEPSAMVVNPLDGRAWLAVGRDLFQIDESGVLSEIDLGSTFTGLALDRAAGIAWVGQLNSVLSFDHSTGAAIGSVPAPSGSIQDLAVDAAGRLWLATSSGLYSGVTESGSGDLISTASYDRIWRRSGGAIFAASGSNLTAFSADGMVPWSTSLFFGLGQIRDLAENAGAGTTWVANQVSLAEIDATGTVLRYVLLNPTILIADLDIANDTDPPTIEFTSPNDGAKINHGSPGFALSYSDSDTGANPESIELTVDGAEAETSCDATETDAMCTLATRLEEGLRAIDATIRDHAGNLSFPAELQLTVDLTKPQLRVISPQDELITNAPLAVALVGSVSEPGTVDLDGVPVVVAPDLTFNHVPLDLSEGANPLTLRATDEAGNQTTVQITVTVDTVPPLPAVEELVSTGLSAGSAMISGGPGAAEGGSIVHATNTRTGETASAVVGGEGSFSVTLLAIDGDLVQLRVVDLAGNASPAITVAVSTPVTWSCNDPPDPARIAPEVDTTVLYDMFEANRFLWETATPVQAGVTPNSITSERIILLRGRVLDEAGEPLPGVKVAIKDHPEFGCTSTRLDGRFDLAANGGGPVILRFEQESYFSVDRREDTASRQYYHLDDVVMTPIPTESHQVALGQTDAQFLSAPTVTDADGSRATAFIVPAGTQASLRFADGSTQQASSLTVRVKEYTVGDNGPNAMPAALPPTSGYTYAFEVTADEALATGALSVDFTQPLFHYAENFLGFGVGEYVPTGYYDKLAGAWVPSGNGIVVEILSVDSGGRAVLDFDGDGLPEDPEFLTVNEITDGELALVAAQYAVGQTLWRVPIPHFTTWDCNWPYGPPEDARPPGPDAVDQEPDTERNDAECGSVIECQSQTLRERIPIVGTPYSLHYNSTLTPGKKSNRRIKVKLLDEDTPSSVEFIQVKVEVAGQLTSAEFSITSAPQEWVYEWDGLDALGRPVIGETIARIEVGYGYSPAYMSAWSESSLSTGGGGTGDSGDRVSSLLSFGRSSATWTQIGERTSGTTKFILRRQFRRTMRSFTPDVFGFGGWVLDRQLFLDRDTQTLVSASGFRAVAKIDRLRTVVDGDTSHPVFAWENGDWVQTSRILRSEEIEAIPGEGLFFSWTGAGGEVMKRLYDGTIYKIAGTGDSPPWQNGVYLWEHEGDLAMNAPLARITSLLNGPDGILFVADTGRVFHIESDGRIYLVAGNGDLSDYHSGDGGPATEAGIGTPIGLALGPDGGLYIAQRRWVQGTPTAYVTLVLRRVDLQTGTITTYAGIGTENCSAGNLEGKNAYDACIVVPSSYHGRERSGSIDILFDDAGGLLFPNHSYSWDDIASVIWRVAPSGAIERFAGTGVSFSSGDGGPATEAQIDRPIGVDQMGASRVIVSRLHYSYPWSSLWVREVDEGGTISTLIVDRIDALSHDPSTGITYLSQTPPYVPGEFPSDDIVAFLTGYEETAEGINVPSLDGRDVHLFETTGRITHTVDALGKIPVRIFHYDSAGYLVAIEDRDGDRTTIARSGSSIEITAPDGIRTTLSLNADGYATSIDNSAGENWQFDYSSDGLMTAMTSARGGQWQFAYDHDGRLIHDTDPEGGFKQLVRSQNGQTYTVSVTTAGGRTTSYDVLPYGDGTEQRTNTTGDLVESKALLKHRAGAVEMPDGTFINVQTNPDPRFGNASPYASTVTVDTPSGRVRQVTRSRTTSLLEDQITETVTLNGRSLTSQYDQVSNSITTTTPEGRVVITQLNDLGRVDSIAVGGLAAIQFSYNAQGKLSSMSTTADSVTRSASFGYGADGWLASAMDPLGRATTWNRDAVGRVTSQTLPDRRTIGFGYDANGNPTSITPPGRPAHGFSYSHLDQATGYDPPGSPTASYSYDLDRRLTGINFPSGGAVNLTHDTENRLLSIDTNDDDLTLTYVPGTTHVAGISRSNGQSNAYTYDGFLPLSQSWSGVVSGNVFYDYDADFRINSLSIDGTPISYGYDGDGLLTQAGALTATRDPANGLLTSTTLDIISGSWVYNGFGEPVAHEATDGINTLFREEMDRDLLGRVAHKRETFGTTTTTITDYGYDETGRLVWVDIDGARAATYTYDSNDNRLTKVTSSGTTSATYDDQDRLLTYGNATYTWNDDGDLMTRTTGTFTETFDYDVFGNLVTYSSPSIDIEYVIDGRNRRVGKKINGTLVEGFLYADQLNPVAELDGSGNVISTFVYGTRPNTPDYMVRDGVTYRVISDHLGSVRLVVNASDGTIAQRMDYDAWGNVVYDSSPGFQPFGFAGGIYDRHTGLTRFGARDYDPKTGCWTARDPILFAGGDTNLYGYVNNSPVSWTDPSGFGGFCFRPLKGNPWIGGASGDLGGLIDSANLNFAHEEYFFDPDENGDQASIGFNPAQDAPAGWWTKPLDKPGAIQEDDPNNQDSYRLCRAGTYDDSIMQEAIEELKDEARWDTYNLFDNNCQDFASAMRQKYWEVAIRDALAEAFGDSAAGNGVGK